MLFSKGTIILKMQQVVESLRLHHIKLYRFQLCQLDSSFSLKYPVSDIPPQLEGSGINQDRQTNWGSQYASQVKIPEHLGRFSRNAILDRNSPLKFVWIAKQIFTKSWSFSSGEDTNSTAHVLISQIILSLNAYYQNLFQVITAKFLFFKDFI